MLLHCAILGFSARKANTVGTFLPSIPVFLIIMAKQNKMEANEPNIGLCATCVHAREIQSDRGSVFYFCELSATDPAFPKYPRLPVLRCSGYTKVATT
jgi:hypothetical protein